MLGLKLALRIGRDIIDVMGKLLSKVAIRSTYSENLAGSRSLVTEIDKAGVLDDATILLTPTAYSNTRVHSVKTYTGDELVTNGTFDTDSDWDLQNGATITSGYANFPLSTSKISQPIPPPTQNSTYRVEFNSIRTNTSSTAVIIYGNGFYGISDIPNVGKNILYITTNLLGGSQINTFQISAAINGTIDNISVVEVSSDFAFDRASSATRINSDGLVQDMQSITDVELVQNGDFEELGDDLVTNGTFDTDSDWDLSNATIQDGYLTLNGSSVWARQNILSLNKTYYFELDAVVRSGTARIQAGGGADNFSEGFYIIGSTGFHSGYISSLGVDTFLYLIRNSTCDIDIDNVSVQQVDPNDYWTIQNNTGTDTEITSGNLRIETDGAYTEASQSSILVGGNQYELIYTILSSDNGDLGLVTEGNVTVSIPSSVGTHTYYFTAHSTSFVLKRRGGALNATIDNISVKDITFSEDVDLARINYDSNGDNGHWLLEPTSTNQITYSQDLSQWTSDDVTVTDNNAISPDGTQNASKIELDSGTSIKRISLGSMPTSSVNRSFSVFIKANSDFTGAVQLVHSGDLQGFANFDLSDGTVGSTGSKTTANIVSYANDWYRCTAIFDSTNTFASTVYLWIQDNDSGSYGGSTSATGSIFAYGFQYEALSYATSYIPTYGSTVTRATETLTGSGNSTLINSTEGVLYAEIAALADDGTARNMALSDGTTSNRIVMVYTNISNQIRFYLEGTGGTITVNHTLTNSTELVKAAVRYKSQDFAFYINGVQIDTNNSSITFSGLNDLSFYNPFGGGSSPFYGKCKALAVFDRALNDDELELLTGITNYGSFNELAQANGYTII